MSDDGSNPLACGTRHLSCAERAAVKQCLIASARAARSRLLVAWIGSAVRPFALAWRGPHELARRAARSLRARQRRMAELRQLAAMNDRELRDIGITRLDIRAAARSGGHWTRYGLRAATTQTNEGENDAESLLDCPRLGS
jgi:uncharacterized protein YjiS (DUF1127 family)